MSKKNKHIAILKFTLMNVKDKGNKKALSLLKNCSA